MPTQVPAPVRLVPQLATKVNQAVPGRGSNRHLLPGSRSLARKDRASMQDPDQYRIFRVLQFDLSRVSKYSDSPLQYVAKYTPYVAQIFNETSLPGVSRVRSFTS